MDQLIILIPIAIGLGLIGLVAFLWSLRSGQFDDLEGAAHRILFDDDEEQDRPPADPTDLSHGGRPGSTPMRDDTDQPG